MSMSMAAPGAARVEQHLETPLTWFEQLRIGVRLGSAMVAGLLLAVGWMQQTWGPAELADVAQMIMALAALIVAAPIFWEAVRGLFFSDAHSMAEQLVALATLAAMVTGDFVTATLIPLILSLGHFLEERSVLGAQAAIEGLKTLHARKAFVLTDQGEKEVSPADLRPGDILLVRPGDVIAADGEIVQGASTVDQSSITGESTPEEVEPGGSVYAGSVNLTGLIHVRVTKAGDETALGRVAELLREAEQSKTPVLKLIERYAGYYVPIVLIIAGTVLFVTRDMSRAVAVLVVGCPGALILAGPTAMIASLAAASKLGILIKNTRFLEALADVDTVVLDKTGTVTLGRMELTEARPIDPAVDPDRLLQLAARCGRGSRHPVSKAIVRAAEAARLLDDELPARIEEVSGKGMILREDGSTYYLGRRLWIAEQGVAMPEEPVHLGSIVWLARVDESLPRGAAVLGCFLLADRPRPEAKAALQQLRRIGVGRSILLTGDRREVAERIAADLQIDTVIAEVLPEQKFDVIDREHRAGNIVMMVGDGVNDALALAKGDVGIALGAVASDIALQSADVALMNNDLRRLPIAVELARGTRSVIHQNVLIGAGSSILMVWLASIGIVAPLVGALLHNVGELFVIFNSARLLRHANIDETADEETSEHVG